jgi:hypothetical protein
MTTTTPATFTVGRSYSFSSICDSDCVWTIEIVKRTAKTVTFLEYGSKTITRRIKTDEERGEWIEPHGRHSMSPICWAGEDEVVPDEVDEETSVDRAEDFDLDRVALRKLKTFDALSRETEAFTAEITLRTNGEVRTVGTIRNDGGGGTDVVWIEPEIRGIVDSWIEEHPIRRAILADYRAEFGDVPSRYGLRELTWTFLRAEAKAREIAAKGRLVFQKRGDLYQIRTAKIGRTLAPHSDGNAYWAETQGFRVRSTFEGTLVPFDVDAYVAAIEGGL